MPFTNQKDLILTVNSLVLFTIMDSLENVLYVYCYFIDTNN